jgi:hypothetical protein
LHRVSALGRYLSYELESQTGRAERPITARCGHSAAQGCTRWEGAKQPLSGARLPSLAAITGSSAAEWEWQLSRSVSCHSVRSKRPNTARRGKFAIGTKEVLLCGWPRLAVQDLSRGGLELRD